MNFQGRLADSNGDPVADGMYNMKFRIFDAASSGTELWSETRETTNRVQVTDGLFSVQLGDVTSLTPAIFNTSNPRYFEVELPTPATAVCSTAACASFTEGPMTPRNPLGASAYAFNADTVDGIDGASLAQQGAANTFTAANIFNNTVMIGSANSATKFVINDNSTTALLTADTTNTIVKIGTSGSASLANVRLLSVNAEFTGTVRVGNATNGVDISSTGIVLKGDARNPEWVTFAAEYPGAVFTGDGTNNGGSLSSDFCSVGAGSMPTVNSTVCGTYLNSMNYYQWQGTQAGVSDYDIFVQYMLPANYDSGSITNLWIDGWGTSTATEKVILSMYDDYSGELCATTSNAVKEGGEWAYDEVASPGCEELVAGDYVVFKIRLEATQGNIARAGGFGFVYRTKF